MVRPRGRLCGTGLGHGIRGRGGCVDDVVAGDIAGLVHVDIGRRRTDVVRGTRDDLTARPEWILAERDLEQAASLEVCHGDIPDPTLAYVLLEAFDALRLGVVAAHQHVDEEAVGALL